MAQATHDIRREAVLERERKVLQLRLAGVSFSRIASVVGYRDAPTAREVYQRAVERQEFAREAEELRMLDNLRYDRLIEAAWPLALKGTLMAFDRVLAVMRDKQRLNGTEAPQRIVVRQVDRSAVGELIEALRAEKEELLRQNAARELQAGSIDVQSVEHEEERFASAAGA